MTVVEAASAEHTVGRGTVPRDCQFYVSMVMCGRHDDMRGDYAGRLQNSLDFLFHQAMRFGVRMEVIVVEWNPFPGASRLASLLRMPPGSSTAVRVITVDHSFHQDVEGETGQGFFEFMAKNVGARRARGRFVLFTNGDVLLSDSVMEMLAGEALDEGSFYRVARSEIPGLMDPLSPLNMRVAAMEELMEVLSEERTCHIGEKECPGEYNRGVCERGGRVEEGHLGLEDEPFLPAAGDFFLISKRALHRMGGYHQVPSTTHLDSLLVCKARGMGLRQVVLLRPCALLHQNHPAPVPSMRYILPGWELSDELCARKAQEARALALKRRGTLQTAGGAGSQGEEVGRGGPHGHAGDGMWEEEQAEWEGRDGDETCPLKSLDENWGFPDEELAEALVPAASPDDWQVCACVFSH
jgi:hypothetical protein